MECVGGGGGGVINFFSLFVFLIYINMSWPGVSLRIFAPLSSLKSKIKLTSINHYVFICDSVKCDMMLMNEQTILQTLD